MSCLNQNLPQARKAWAPPVPMNPNERMQRFGPIRPMNQRPSLLERLLFS